MEPRRSSYTPMPCSVRVVRRDWSDEWGWLRPGSWRLPVNRQLSLPAHTHLPSLPSVPGGTMHDHMVLELFRQVGGWVGGWGAAPIQSEPHTIINL